MGDLVRLEVDDGVGTIRLDRPPANAIDDQLLGDLRVAAEAAAERDDVRAVVIWGRMASLIALISCSLR